MEDGAGSIMQEEGTVPPPAVAQHVNHPEAGTMQFVPISEVANIIRYAVWSEFSRREDSSIMTKDAITRMDETSTRMNNAIATMEQFTEYFKSLLQPTEETPNQFKIHEEIIVEHEHKPVHEEEITDLKQQIQELTTHINTFSEIYTKLESFDNVQGKQEAEIKQLQTQVSSLNASLANQEAKNTQLQTQVSSLNASYTNQEAEIKQLQAQVSSLNESLESQKAETNRLKQKEEDRGTELRILDIRLSRVRDELLDYQEAQENLRCKHNSESGDDSEYDDSDKEFEGSMIPRNGEVNQQPSPPPEIIDQVENILPNWPLKIVSNRRTILDRAPYTRTCRITDKFSKPFCGCGCMKAAYFHRLQCALDAYNALRDGKLFCTRVRDQGMCTVPDCPFSHGNINTIPCKHLFGSARRCERGQSCGFAHSDGRIGDLPELPPIPGYKVRFQVEFKTQHLGFEVCKAVAPLNKQML
uniref:C3H1-type domain-containing protein n=1 Tax=viral metagenome TaxID=1070528 RepID=A0A6C0H7R0_9ZZZZ